MRRVGLLARLNAIGSLVDGLIAELEEEGEEGAAGSGGECSHPLDMRIDETTMGGPEGWRCRACGFSTLPTEDNQTPEESDDVSNGR